MEFNLQTLEYDDEWLATITQIEEENQWDGEVGAWLAQRKTIATTTPQQVQAMMAQMRLQQILFTELRQWMTTWNLGVAFQDAFTCARECVQSHILEVTEPEQTYFTALLEEDALKVEDKPIRTQAVEQLQAMLTETDWKAIAQAAADSMQTQIMALEPRSVA